MKGKISLGLCMLLSALVLYWVWQPTTKEEQVLQFPKINTGVLLLHNPDNDMKSALDREITTYYPKGRERIIQKEETEGTFLRKSYDTAWIYFLNGNLQFSGMREGTEVMSHFYFNQGSPFSLFGEPENGSLRAENKKDITEVKYAEERNWEVSLVISFIFSLLLILLSAAFYFRIKPRESMG